MELSASEFKKLLASGKLKPSKGTRFKTTAAIGQRLLQEPCQKKKSSTKTIKLPRAEAKELSEMKLVLKLSKIDFTPELQFAKPRKFRFDIAIPEKMIAIEYEGINSSKSRHTTLKGYSKDAEKYNLAASLGWKVLRYTVLTYPEMLGELLPLISRNTVHNP